MLVDSILIIILYVIFKSYSHQNSFIMVKKFTLFILLLVVANIQAQVYEDFEGGAKLPWTAFNGAAYGGAIDNPGKDAVNSSDFVGKLSNNDVGDFCFLLSDLPAPADLSTNNLFKMKLWSPIAPTRILFKLEGGGKAVEKFVDVTEANKWVEYSFDLSGGSNFTTLSKILLAVNPFTTPQAADFYFDDIRAVAPGSFYETFETGNELGWQGLDGVLEAPVDNPAPNKINSSAKCGKYVKSDKHAYSLLLADRGTNTFDLSSDNQFKMQVHASAPTQVLFKMEGPGGPAIEKIANIGLANAWQEYTFDLSAAKEYKHLTKIVVFFDPGVETSGDTYYFDNVYAVPKGACTDVTPDPSIVDDFECNRNATYVNGWDSLSVVNNPAPSATNNSAKVGKYIDPQGEEWAALLADFTNPIDLSKNNQLNLKVWSAKPSKFLAKLEGGASAPKEIPVQITEGGSWQEYTVDFSDQAIASHKKIVLFFNHGTLPEAGDVYYIDDIKWTEKKTTDIENFENGAALPWEPYDQLTVFNGTFEVVDNPAPLAPNTSAKVGKYTKGTSAFSTVAAVSPGLIDISVKPQYNLDVWAPVGAKSVIFQLESLTSGNKEVKRDLKTPGAWETVSFDFTSYQAITDWAAMKIIFNPGVEEAGTVFYFDNLRQGETTVDPCENTVKISNILDDYECQRNYDYGVGKAFISAVNNPKTTPNNSSTKVGQYKDPAKEPWAALCAEIPNGLDLEVFNQMSVQVLSPNADVPLLMKLEGGTSPAKEVWTTIKTANEWETVVGDFSSEKLSNHKRVCLFFNGGVENPNEDKYYMDNWQLAHAPYDGCIMNFDDAAFLSTKWRYFPSDNSGDFELVDNPNPSGINTSAKVGKAVEKASGEQPWQGMYTDLESYVKFGSDKLVKMKILAPKAGPVTMKLERPLKVGGAPQSGDLTVVSTKANEWEELTFDFSTTPIVDDGLYARVTLIWDISAVPTTDQIYYFDDIKLTGGDCGDLVATNDVQIEQLSIAPNPVSNVLELHNMTSAKSSVITDIYGRVIAKLRNDNGAESQAFDVSNINQGTYVVTAFDSKGRPVAVAKFVKI